LKFLYYINIKDIEYIQERDNSIKFVVKGNNHLYENDDEEGENLNYSIFKYKFEEREKQGPIVKFLNHILVIEKSRLSYSGFEQETRRNSISKPKTSHDIGDIKNKEKKLYHLGINNTNMYFRFVPLKGENMNSNNIQSKIGLIVDDTEPFNINELKIFLRDKAIIGLVKPTKDGHFIWSFYKNEDCNIECDQENLINNNNNGNDNVDEELINIISSIDNPSELNTIYSIIMSLELKLRNSKAYQEIQQINNIFYMQKLCKLLVMERPHSIFQESIFSFKMKNKKMGRPESIADSIAGYSLAYSITSTRRKSLTGALLKEKSATCNKYMSSGSSYFEVNTLNSSKLRGISSWGATLRRNITFTNKPSIASEVVFLNTFTSIVSIIEKKCDEVIDVEVNENDIKQRDMETLVKKIYSGKSINEKNVSFSQLWIILKSLIYEVEIISQSRLTLLQTCKDKKQSISILLTIPDDKIAILRKIIQLSLKIIEKENVNKFGVDKISSELCPCLFHQEEKYDRNLFGYLLGKTNNTPKDPSPKIESEIQNNIFHWIIEYSDVIMSGDITKLEKEGVNEEKEVVNETIEKPIPVHSILKPVKEISVIDEIEEVNDDYINDNEKTINKDLERENSKRSKRSVEKKNVIINEENNNYIEDISYSSSNSPSINNVDNNNVENNNEDENNNVENNNEDDNNNVENNNEDDNNNVENNNEDDNNTQNYYESNKIHNDIYPKKFVSDTDINKAHLNEINKFRSIDEKEIIDSNKTLIDKGEEREVNANGKFLKLDFEASTDTSIFDDMKDILTTPWENAK